MANRFTAGKRAISECDVCGFRFKLKELKNLVVKTKQVAIKACPQCWVPDQPQLLLGTFPVADPQAVRDPRPDFAGYAQSRSNIVPVQNFLNSEEYTSAGGAIGTVTLSLPPPTPTDPYYANVSLLLHMDGSNGSTTFTDNSPSPKTITASGAAQVSTSVVKYGTGSGYFDGNSGSYLSAPSSADFTLGSDNFTVEGWFNPGAWGGTNRALISRRTSGWTAGAWTIWVNMGVNTFNIYSYEYDPTGYIPLLNNGGTLILPNVWQYFAWVRNGNVFTLYLDGIQVSTNTSSITIANNSQPLLVGAEDSLFAAPFSGYIDDLRITKGVARYTSNFTPPTGPFPNS